MHRKGGDQDQYMMRKGDYQDDYPRGDRGGGGREGGGRGGGGGGGGGGEQQRQPRGRKPYKKKVDPCSQFNMMRVITKGGGAQIRAEKKRQTEAKQQQQRQGTDPSKINPIPIHREEYASLKAELDRVMEYYNSNHSNNQQEENTGQRPREERPREERPREERQRGNRQCNQVNNNRQEQHRPVQARQQKGERRRQRQEDGSDDSDWSIKQEDKYSQKEQKRNDNPDMDQSDWLQDGPEQKNTPQVKEVHKNLKREDYSSNRNNNGRNGQQRGNNNGRKQRSDPVRKQSSSSNEEGRILPDYLLQDIAKANELASLVHEDCPEDRQKKQQENEKKKEEEKPKPSEQEFRDKLSSFEADKMAKISLKFQSEQNILEIKIKKLELTALGTTLKIHSDSSVSFKDYPSIKGETISKYITFKTTSHFYPKFLVNQPENMPHLVEGDEENEPKKIRSVIELELCSVRCSSAAAEKSCQIDESLVCLQLVMVRCMECETKNQITVSHPDYSVAGSCHSCSSKILGKVTDLWIHDTQ